MAVVLTAPVWVSKKLPRPNITDSPWRLTSKSRGRSKAEASTSSTWYSVWEPTFWLLSSTVATNRFLYYHKTDEILGNRTIKQIEYQRHGWISIARAVLEKNVVEHIHYIEIRSSSGCSWKNKNKWIGWLMRYRILVGWKIGKRWTHTSWLFFDQTNDTQADGLEINLGSKVLLDWPFFFQAVIATVPSQRLHLVLDEVYGTGTVDFTGTLTTRVRRKTHH